MFEGPFCFEIFTYSLVLLYKQSCFIVCISGCFTVAAAFKTYVFNMKLVRHRRLQVIPRDAMTSSSPVMCAVACHVTSWCVSANVFTGDGTSLVNCCQKIRQMKRHWSRPTDGDIYAYVKKLFNCHNSSHYQTAIYFLQYM